MKKARMIFFIDGAFFKRCVFITESCLNGKSEMGNFSIEKGELLTWCVSIINFCTLAIPCSEL